MEGGAREGLGRLPEAPLLPMHGSLRAAKAGIVSREVMKRDWKCMFGRVVRFRMIREEVVKRWIFIPKSFCNEVRRPSIGMKLIAIEYPLSNLLCNCLANTNSTW